MAHQARLAPGLIVANLAGGLLLAAGIAGLVLPDVFPELAPREVAASLIGVGILLEAASLVRLLRTLSRRQGTPRP